jgi:hypothetical protein
VVKSEDESEGSVGLELVGVLVQHRLEQVDVTRANSLKRTRNVKKTELFERKIVDYITATPTLIAERNEA